MKAILSAVLAAVFYAINIPASKVLLRDVGPTTMAALLYLGAGIGITILSLLNAHDRTASAPLMMRRFMERINIMWLMVPLVRSSCQLNMPNHAMPFAKGNTNSCSRGASSSPHHELVG